jgi:hypothetical protein
MDTKMKTHLPKKAFIKLSRISIQLLTLASLIFLNFEAKAQLSAGDIAFVHFNSDGSVDEIGFVALTDISAGEIIYFSENEPVNATTMNTGEGVLTWTAPAGGVACGTVVTLDASANASVGTASETASWALSTSGDGVWAFQGNSTTSVTTWLAAIGVDGANTITTANEGNIANTTLSLGVNAMGIAETDNCAYIGITTGTSAALLAAINNDANWTRNNVSNIYFAGSFTVSGCGSACTAPSNQASNISFSNILSGSMDVSWTIGNGAGRVVIINTSNTFTAPADGSNPAANTAYSGGQQVIYNGIGNSVSITGLTYPQTYWFRVYEYCDTDRNYTTSTSTNNPRSQTTSAPAPLLSAGSLTAFGSECIGGIYGPNSFTITGTNLSTAAVTVGALSGYQFATVLGGFYSNNLSITQPGGAFTRTIYVNFSPSSDVSYNGNIDIGGGGASSIIVAASGTGLNTPPSVSTASTSSITFSSATVEGSISSIGCSSISYYGIEYSTSSGFTPGSGTQVSSSNLSVGNFSSDIGSLNANQTYYYLAYATNAGGTSYGSESSFTTLNLDAPIANPGSVIGDFAFTANWDPVAGATGYRLDVSTTPFISTNASDLFISEYLEGSASNKYIEIFNGTGAPVNLSDYRLRLFSNGAGSPSSDVLLSGTLANNDVIVYENSAASIYSGIPNAAVNFNGDDAVALWKISSSSYVDIFGVIGNDPGTQWSLGGNSTLNQTLVRNASITGGVTVNPPGTGAGAFSTLSTEWTEFAIDFATNLGLHTFSAGGPIYVPGYQDLPVTGISQLVSGLTTNTTYYYRVRAVSATSTSDNSNVILVLTTNTGCASGVNITSFSPNNSPQGTRVTITGSNFSSATSVTFNNIPSTYFTIISNTEIEAQVPATGSGLIRVADSGGCFDTSPTSFTYLSNTGTCLGIISDLIISEGYDPSLGNNHYIEIYNGTGTAIDLNSTADYSLRLLNKNSSSDPSPTTYNLDITGVINPSETRIYYAGANGGLASLPAQGFNNGFNEFDELILLKNNVIIDRVQFPNNVGYDYRRSSTVTGPNASYNAVEWTRIETGENISDIGSFAVGANFNITTQPLDDSAEPCDPFSLSVVSSNPSVTYQWLSLNTLGNWIQMGPSAQISGYDTNQLAVNPSNGFDGVQFYCQISQALCIKPSNAVQFLEIPNLRRYFRSIGSGNWVTGNIWEYATSNAGPWTTSCLFPTANTSDEIVIRNGHIVTVGGFDLTLDQVIIQSGGNLQLSATDAITFENGAGVDLTIEGTFTDNANSGGGNGVFMNTGATWQMGINGTLVKTNNSSFAVYRDNYQGGMSIIPATSTIVIRSVAGSNPSFTAVGNTFYPNLVFEATSGIWNPVTLGSRFNGTSDFPTVKGNLDIGGSGSGQVVIYNQNTNLNPLTVQGNVIVRAGNTLTNLGSSIGTGFTFNGNLAVQGTFTVSSASNSNYLQLSGSSTQSFTGNGTVNLANLRINNTSVFGIDIQRNLTVNNELSMIDGNLQTGANLLTLGTDVTNRGALNYIGGFVVGRLRRWFSGTNAGNTSSLFPIGVLGSFYYNKSVNLEYTSAASSPGHLTVEFINLPMASVTSGLPIAAANTGGAGFNVVYVEDEGYWQIDNQTGTLTDGLYKISLTGEQFQSVTDVSSLTLLKRVGLSAWTCPGNHITAAGPTTMPIVSRTGVSGFSNFGFGSGPNNPLPIDLLSFQASPNGNEVLLEWVTGSEVNNQLFNIERSIDAINFTQILTQEASGNSSLTIKYRDFDKDPLQGISYYRLKQTDFNGTYTYSEIVAVNFNSSESAIEWMNFNKNTGNLQGFIDVNSKYLSMRIIDLSGRIIKETFISEVNGLFNLETQVSISGIYFIELISSSNKSKIFKAVY